MDSQRPMTLIATDPNNDPITYRVVTQPTNGVLSGTAPNQSYIPNPDNARPTKSFYYLQKLQSGILNNEIFTSDS